MSSSPKIYKLKTFLNHYISYQKHFVKVTPGSPSPPTLIFIPGFHSTMQHSNKSSHLFQYCIRHDVNYLTLDHYAHGQSTGSFLDREATIGRWYTDLCKLIQSEITQISGQIILVGSSMGAWLSLLIASREDNIIREKTKGIIGIAPAINFTERLWDEIKKINQDPIGNLHMGTLIGETYHRKSIYSSTGSYPIPIHFIEESRKHYLHLKSQIKCPVVFIHGKKDPDVPYQDSVKWANVLKGDDGESRNGGIKVILIEDGDHRLSSEEDLCVLDEEVGKMCFG